MKTTCDMKCEWKEWHDERLRKWRRRRDVGSIILGVTLLGAFIFGMGYFTCWVGRDVARSELDASRLPATQQQVRELTKEIWDLHEKHGEIIADTLSWGARLDTVIRVHFYMED